MEEPEGKCREIREQYIRRLEEGTKDPEEIQWDPGWVRRDLWKIVRDLRVGEIQGIRGKYNRSGSDTVKSGVISRRFRGMKRDETDRISRLENPRKIPETQGDLKVTLRDP
jgi:hypothetical protein